MHGHIYLSLDFIFICLGLSCFPSLHYNTFNATSSSKVAKDDSLVDFCFHVRVYGRCARVFAATYTSGFETQYLLLACMHMMRSVCFFCTLSRCCCFRFFIFCRVLALNEVSLGGRFRKVLCSCRLGLFQYINFAGGLKMLDLATV